MESFEELFHETLKDVYYAEKLIARTLPKLAKKVSSEALAQAFTEHAEQTKQQIQRLEQVFEHIGKKPKAKRCAAMEGLMAEADELMEEVEESPVRDAGLLACAQAVEHYEIARYGTLKAWADKMGHEDVVDLLEQTLEEEKETDKKLTQLAESEINMEADDEEEGSSSKKHGKQDAMKKMAMASSGKNGGDEDEDDDEDEDEMKAAMPQKTAAKPQPAKKPAPAPKRK